MGASGLRERDPVTLSRIFHLTYCNDNHPIREMMSPSRPHPGRVMCSSWDCGRRSQHKGFHLMRKLMLSVCALFCSIGLVLAGEVTFVKFDKEKKEVTVKDGDKESTYKITDKTTFKAGDKDVPSEKALPRFEKMKEGKTKFDLTAEKDTVTEIKFPAKKK